MRTERDDTSRRASVRYWNNLRYEAWARNEWLPTTASRRVDRRIDRWYRNSPLQLIPVGIAYIVGGFTAGVLLNMWFRGDFPS